MVNTWQICAKNLKKSLRQSFWTCRYCLSSKWPLLASMQALSLRWVRCCLILLCDHSVRYFVENHKLQTKLGAFEAGGLLILGHGE